MQQNKVISFVFVLNLVRKKTIKFWQILKNANVGPNVDISVTADRRLCGGQYQGGKFQYSCQRNWKMAFGTVLFNFLSSIEGVAILGAFDKSYVIRGIVFINVLNRYHLST